MTTTLTEKRFFEWHEDDKCVTLRNKGGSYGGGSEAFIVQTKSDHYAEQTTRESGINMSTTER